MASSLPWHPSPPASYHTHRRLPTSVKVQAFQRSDFDVFAKRMASGEIWRDAWRRANSGFEQLLYETKKTAERIDRRYSLRRRLSAVGQSAADRARKLDGNFEITRRWRTFTLDFTRNWPGYRKQLNDILDTPLGRSFATIFFLWLALGMAVPGSDICNMGSTICWSSSYWGCCQ